MKKQLMMVFAATTGLSACGGGGGGDEAAGQELARLTQAQAMVDRLSFQSETLLLPTTGTAAYEGFSVGVVETASAGDLSVVGDMSITVDFTADTLTGSASNFVGLTDDSGLLNFSGSLDLDDGSIDGPGNAFSLTVNGALNGGGYALVFDDGAEGVFLGANGDGLVFQTDQFGTVLINGVERPGTIGGLAEQ